MRSSRVALLGAILLVLVGVACGSTAATGPSGPSGYWSRHRLLGAEPFVGTHFHPLVTGEPHNARETTASIRVGALFESGGSSNHFCTASVVTSPGGDLLITAAHCINAGGGGGYRSDIVFAPGYRDGEAPYGLWTPAHLIVAPQWSQSGDPDYDVGFIVLKPLDGQHIESVLGANTLGTSPADRYLVRVTGYPGSADAPITCINYTSSQSATQLRFECDDYTNGTSGSPWVTKFDPRTRTGTIIGVIGGYEQGGSTPEVSYSVRFGDSVQQLYQQAIQADPSSSH